MRHTKANRAADLFRTPSTPLSETESMNEVRNPMRCTTNERPKNERELVAGLRSVDEPSAVGEPRAVEEPSTGEQNRPARDIGSAAGSQRRSGGFTLIEIMAVVIIMGLLMGLVGVSVFSQVDKARVITARAKISQLENALEFYRMDNSRYPTTEQGLEALIEEPAGARNYPPGGYLQKKEAMLDPWDQPFQYQSPGEHNQRTFDLWSLGADSAPGGSDLDRDIGNWASEEQS